MESKRKSLSEIKVTKKKISKNLRNYLAVPYKDFWPSLPLSEAAEILDSLKALQRARATPSESHTTLLKKKRKKNDSCMIVDDDQVEVAPKDEFREFLILGVNTLAQSMENNECGCCLLAEETDPQFIIQHLATLARQKEVPVIIIPNLKEVAKENLGFPTISLGFRKVVLDDPENIFYPCCQLIKNTAKELLFDNCDNSDIDVNSCPNIIGISRQLNPVVQQPVTLKPAADRPAKPRLSEESSEMLDNFIRFTPMDDDEEFASLNLFHTPRILSVTFEEKPNKKRKRNKNKSK